MGDKICISFGRPAPWNLGGRKNVQNSGGFLTTFNFDRYYLRNGPTYRKSEKYFIKTTSPSKLDDKNLLNFGPQTKE